MVTHGFAETITPQKYFYSKKLNDIYLRVALESLHDFERVEELDAISKSLKKIIDVPLHNKLFLQQYILSKRKCREEFTITLVGLYKQQVEDRVLVNKDFQLFFDNIINSYSVEDEKLAVADCVYKQIRQPILSLGTNYSRKVIKKSRDCRATEREGFLKGHLESYKNIMKSTDIFDEKVLGEIKQNIENYLLASQEKVNSDEVNDFINGYIAIFMKIGYDLVQARDYDKAIPYFKQYLKLPIIYVTKTKKEHIHYYYIRSLVGSLKQKEDKKLLKELNKQLTDFSNKYAEHGKQLKNIRRELNKYKDNISGIKIPTSLLRETEELSSNE